MQSLMLYQSNVPLIEQSTILLRLNIPRCLLVYIIRPITIHSSAFYYYYYYKRQIYPAVSEALRTGYKNYNVSTQTGPRKADTVTKQII